MAYSYVTGSYYYGNGDSYSVSGYISDSYGGGRLYSGQYVYASSSSSDRFSSTYNETGNQGYYYLSSVSNYSGSTSLGLSVVSYYDSETSSTWTPSSVSTGYYGLGSESGNLSYSSFVDTYFSTYYELDSHSSYYEDGEDYVDEVSDPDFESKTFSYSTDDYQEVSSADESLIISGSDKNSSWSLWGSTGKNKLVGGNKDDILIGGGSTDYLTGGSGSDTFVMTDWEDRSFDFITDFNSKDDLIGISSYMMNGISEDASVEVLTYNQIKNLKTATETFADASADVYILVGSSKEIASVKSNGWNEEILLAINTTAKTIVYDADGNWSAGSSTLAKFTGRFSRSWTGENFLFDLDVVADA